MHAKAPAMPSTELSGAINAPWHGKLPPTLHNGFLDFGALERGSDA
jgi:hypothetical protein